MSLPKLVVGITQGDSNGIGYEVIIKSLADERSLDSFTPVVYGSSKLFGFYRFSHFCTMLFSEYFSVVFPMKFAVFFKDRFRIPNGLIRPNDCFDVL